MNGELRARSDTLSKRLAIVAVLAFAFSLIWGFVDPRHFFRAYLTGYVFWLGISLGCWGILMLHHLVGGRWGFMIQRVLESAIQTLPLLAVLFVPLLFGVGYLYPWARSDVVAADPLLQQKAAYLNVPFFIARAVLYFAVWISVGRLLSSWSVEQDRTANPALTLRLQQLSGPGLILYGLTVTFASIDWLMSIEPHWYSTIYGMLFIVSFALSGMAFAIVITARLGSEAALEPVLAADRFHDLGNLLLAFVMLWAYVHFSQFLLIWSENLAEEIPWYLHRIGGGWEWLALALVLFQFAIPFVLLLSRSTKRNPGTLASIAAGILFVQWLAVIWMVAPSFSPERFYLHLLDFLVPIGIGAVWLAGFLHYLGRKPLLPLRDPRFAELVEQPGAVP